jgi:hypothetical protein
MPLIIPKLFLNFLCDKHTKKKSSEAKAGAANDNVARSYGKNFGFFLVKKNDVLSRPIARGWA